MIVWGVCVGISATYVPIIIMIPTDFLIIIISILIYKNVSLFEAGGQMLRATISIDLSILSLSFCFCLPPSMFVFVYLPVSVSLFFVYVSIYIDIYIASTSHFQRRVGHIWLSLEGEVRLTRRLCEPVIWASQISLYVSTYVLFCLCSCLCLPICLKRLSVSYSLSMEVGMDDRGKG